MEHKYRFEMSSHRMGFPRRRNKLLFLLLEQLQRSCLDQDLSAILIYDFNIYSGLFLFNDSEHTWHFALWFFDVEPESL